MTTVLQEWTQALPLMQQTVLLTAIRGPDGAPKYSPTKFLLRWYRRCILLSAMDGRVLTDPCSNNGGSFTGPSLSSDEDEEEPWYERMQVHVHDYIRSLDAMPHHFHLHFMHAAEILGYKHPDPATRVFWNGVYVRFASDMHLHPETEEEMNSRLGDSRSGWLARADPATVE